MRLAVPHARDLQSQQHGASTGPARRCIPRAQIDGQIYGTKAKDLLGKLQQQKKNAAAKTYARRFDGPIDLKDPVIAGMIGRPLPKGFAGLFDSPLSFLNTTPPRSRRRCRWTGCTPTASTGCPWSRM